MLQRVHVIKSGESFNYALDRLGRGDMQIRDQQIN